MNWLWRLIVSVLMLVEVLFSTSAAGATTPGFAGHAGVFAYDAHHRSTLLTYTTPERGPPAQAPRDTAYDPDGRCPLGALARPDQGVSPSTYDYDNVSGLEQTARRSQTAGKSSSATRRSLVLVERSRVAAKNEHSLLQRALTDRRLNPERGSIGGGGFTGSTTGHGAERLAEAGFDDIDVAILRAGRAYEQSDGATAFVTSAGRNTYNMIVQNADGAIVTAHRGMSYDDLAGLAQNYGWSGW